MSMQELPDDGLDELFRKSAEEFIPPYDPAAWPKLGQQLDRHDRLMAWGKWLRWGLPALLLFLLMGSYYLFTQLPSSRSGLGARQLQNQYTPASRSRTETADVIRDRQPLIEPASRQTGSRQTGSGVPSDQQSADWDALRSDRTPDPVQPSQAVSPDRVSPDRITPDRVNRDLSSNAGLDLTPLAPVRHAVGQELVTAPDKKRVRSARSPVDVVAVQQPAVQESRADVGTTRLAISPREHTPVRSRGLATHNPDSPDTELVSTPGQPTTDLATTEPGPTATLRPAQPERLVLPDMTLLASHPAIWPRLPLPTHRVVMPESSPEKPTLSQPHQHLSVQFTVAPDLSTIGLKNFERPGTNIGVMLQYQLSSRLSVQLGVLRSLKIYQAKSSEYAWPMGVNWPVWPTGVNGRCTMLDIPLNVRYDAVLRPIAPGYAPVKWFVSGGLTSYVTLRESYVYQYANPNDPKIKYRNWDSPTGKYGFSNLNLSIGYERPVSRRLSWQIEPFLKVPLKPVGFYHIRLVSTGAFFSLRYHL